ncbi:hypothetical protein D3C81_1783700 [compost metagenome]
MGRERIAVRIAAKVDACIAGIADQLCFQVIVALKRVILSLGFNLCFRRDDAQHRKRFHVIPSTSTSLCHRPDFFQTLADFMWVGFGDENQLCMFGCELSAPA